MVKRDKRREERRGHEVHVRLSDRELAALDEYISLFGGTSRSAVVREVVVRHVRERVIEQRTTLFPEYGPSALIRARVAEEASLFVTDDDNDDK